MTSWLRLPSLARTSMIALAMFALAVRPAAAQEVLRDAETEQLFRDIAKPMIVSAGLDPKNVDVVLVQDPEINAFVATGQTVYITSGLIIAADNANEVQGVIAHELGHVAGGDAIITTGEHDATRITLLSLLLAGAAVAAGSPEAGIGIFQAGQQAATGKYLAFSRQRESKADAAGARFLNAAGVSGKGMLSFFKKLQNQEYRYAIPHGDEDSYAYTHPLTGDRIANLTQTLQAAPSWNNPIDTGLEQRFERIKAKLYGYVEDPPRVLVKYPLTDKSVPAHYARAYAYHRGAYPDQALGEADALLAVQPHDPYFLELKGQILLESGKPKEALPDLREAVAAAPDQPLIAGTFGHALVATEDPKNLKEAETVLKNALSRDNDNPFAWYTLGIVYENEGDEARAALATAERYNLEGSPKLALPNAALAMKQLPVGSADYLKAQDIAMVSENAAGKKKKH